MNIINVNYSFKSQPISRIKTEYIVVHHTATTTATVDGIHRHHKYTNGWLGFGYHAYVYKKGYVFGGRPFGTQGAHCEGFNHNSIGVCFEGNFEVDKMTPEQIENGIALLKHLKALYPEAKIVKHKDLFKTSCPGKFFENIIIEKALEQEAIEPQKSKLDTEIEEKIFHLQQLGEPTDLKGLINRLSEIYKNAFETHKSQREIVKQILKKGGL
jgi:N-acetylmuramoyl-L-alanine amidase